MKDKTNKSNKKWLVGYIIWWVGVVLIILSIFTPWWAFGSGVAGNDGYLKLTISPFHGPSIDTPIGSLMEYLAPELKMVSFLIMLPVLIPLIFGILYGIYSGIRRRVSRKIFIAPLWTLVSLVNWFMYYYSVSYLLSLVGFDIPPSGSFDFTYEEYELVNASWGWGIGMYISIISIVVLFSAGYIMRSSLLPKNKDLDKTMEMSPHSIFLILFGIASVLFGVILLVIGSSLFNTPNYGGLFPIIGGTIIFGMAYIGRKEFFVCPRCECPVEVNNIKDKYVCKVCKLNLITNETESEVDDSKNILEKTYDKSREMVDKGIKKTEGTAREVKMEFDEFKGEQKQNLSRMHNKLEKGIDFPIPEKEKNQDQISESNQNPSFSKVNKNPGKPCPDCGSPMRFVKQYSRWWCDSCEEYH